MFSRMAQVPFFYSLILNFIFKVKFVRFFLFCEYLANGERVQTLLLPFDRKSRIYHRMAPLRMLYIMTLTYIFNIMNF